MTTGTAGPAPGVRPRRRVHRWSLIIVVVFLAARSIYFTLGQISPTDDTPIKTYLLLLAYLGAAATVALHPASAMRLVRRLWPYALLVVLAFATAPFGRSDVALLRAGHAVGLLLIAMATAIGFRGSYVSFLRTVFTFTFACLVASALLAVFLPERGLVNVAWNNLRWIGVTGHPNLLGALDVVCTWSLLSLVHYQGVTTARLARCAVPAAFILLTAARSDSRTSEISVLLLVVIFALLWGRRFDAARFARRIAVALSIGIGATAIAVGLDATAPLLGTREGAGDTLSGRPEIWAQGLRMIREHPLGISYDDLASFWASYSTGFDTSAEAYTHFHDGYLDVSAKGGIVSGVVMIVLLWTAGADIWRIRLRDYKHFVASLALLVAMLVYNIQETSFMREIILWAMQIIDWALLPFAVTAGARRRAAVTPHRPPDAAARTALARTPTGRTVRSRGAGPASPVPS